MGASHTLMKSSERRPGGRKAGGEVKGERGGEGRGRIGMEGQMERNRHAREADKAVTHIDREQCMRTWLKSGGGRH